LEKCYILMQRGDSCPGGKRGKKLAKKGRDVCSCEKRRKAQRQLKKKRSAGSRRLADENTRRSWEVDNRMVDARVKQWVGAVALLYRGKGHDSLHRGEKIKN